MRLIDVNKLKENLTTEIYSYSKGDIRKRLFARGLSLAYDIVNRQPTVEPKHGHWVHKYDSWTCSECYYTFHGKPLWKYCPHCGAKNEVEDDNNN